MKKALIVMAAGGLVGGRWAGPAARASSRTTTPPDGGTTLSFTQHTVVDKYFNLGPHSGLGVGQVEIGADDDVSGTTTIGHDGFYCIMSRLSHATADDLCNVDFVLTGGKIDISGLVTSTQNGPGTFTMAIVGGTGTYANARGEATVVSADPDRVTLHVSY
jgi:hypothetical protein